MSQFRPIMCLSYTIRIIITNKLKKKKNEKAKRSKLNSGSLTLISAIYHESRKYGMTN